MPKLLSVPYHPQNEDESLLWLLVPAGQPEPLVVSIDEFMLAWARWITGGQEN
jgi:hypothetical protein